MMNDEIAELKKERDDGLRELGMDLLINFERSRVPLRKYLFKHCKVFFLLLIPLFISSYLAVHNLVTEFTFLNLILLGISLLVMCQITYQMFSVASMINETDSLSYSFGIAVAQAVKSRNDVIEEIQGSLVKSPSLKSRIDFIDEIHRSLYEASFNICKETGKQEQQATILPFKKPKEEPKVN